MPRGGVSRQDNGLDSIQLDGIESYEFDSAELGDPAPNLYWNGENPTNSTPSRDEELVSHSSAKEEVADGESEDESSSEESKSEEDSKPLSAKRSKRAKIQLDAEDVETDASDDTQVISGATSIDEVFADDTAETKAMPPLAPEGYTYASKPSNMLPSRLLKRNIMWLAVVDTKGSRDWIVSEVAGGPLSPIEAANGVTLRLRCDNRLDPKTPPFLSGKNSPVSVSLTLDNYGQTWQLLEG